MITQNQKHQIEAYLYSRKLYHNLHLEIKDHFLSQIFDAMMTYNIGFQEAGFFFCMPLSYSCRLCISK